MENTLQNTLSFQDQGSTQYCFGCGADNVHGHRIKSFWEGNEAVLHWTPEPHHCAGRKDIVYGGIIASLIDCHSVNLAIADAYRRENRPIGSEPKMAYVTANLNVSYRQPTPMGKTLVLRAKVLNVEGRKTKVYCTLSADDLVCADAEVLAVRLKDPAGH